MGKEMIDIDATGKRIKELMNERGLSASDICDALDLESVQSVYAWITPRRKNLPNVENLVLLARVLGVYVEDIIVLKSEGSGEDSTNSL